jgi:hypothetical protein
MKKGTKEFLIVFPCISVVKMLLHVMMYKDDDGGLDDECTKYF